MLWDILIIGLVFFIISPIVQLFVLWLASAYLYAAYAENVNEENGEN